MVSLTAPSFDLTDSFVRPNTKHLAQVWVQREEIEESLAILLDGDQLVTEQDSTS